uniref:Transposase Tc1-like domain-containing protein n=1 Tax=Gasterosteus aculeatus aculeatus TaxID=481459 RepID=A0AAQ4NWJ8_GASAC
MKSTRDKVEEKYRSGSAYKKITQTLNIPQRTIKGIIKKWKEYGTTTNLAREGRPPKLTAQARRASINQETKDDPEGAAKLQRRLEFLSTGLGFALSRTLHRSGLYGRVSRKGRCLKKKISEHVWCSPKGMWETPQTYGRRYSGQMRLKLSFLAIKENALSGQTHHLSPPRERHRHGKHHAAGMLFIGGDWETGQN